MRTGKSLQRCGFPRIAATLLLTLNFVTLAAFAATDRIGSRVAYPETDK